MIIFWRGLGFLIPIIVIVIQLITFMLGRFITNDMYGRDIGSIPIVAGWVISAVLLWIIGRKLNCKVSAPEQGLPDGISSTEKPKSVQTWQHTLFWIPFEYWSIACVGFAVSFSLS